MKLLLLHPEDSIKRYANLQQWDLVVDLGRAPASTYEAWRRLAGCRVISLFDFAQQGEDLHRVRELLQLGMGVVVDQSGIDWWDVLSLMIASELLQITLIRRLASDLPMGCELYSTRPSPFASALRAVAEAKLTNLENKVRAGVRRLGHYGNVARSLDPVQIFRVMQDKFDSQHQLRRRFYRRTRDSHEPAVLLPSAYVNVSRKAVAYAAVLPAQRFLLVCARDSARLRELPPNVQSVSLHPYFISPAQSELESLESLWARMKAKLLSTSEEFALANSANLLDSLPAKLAWLIATRNAWNGLFQTQNIIGCLCADDSNPYTRIPLILAKQRSLPTVACHHGALDFRMAMKHQYADYYLAQGDMERDYIERFCRISSARIVVGAPGTSAPATQERKMRDKSWLVFFSEPYEASSWRSEEVYRELLPRLTTLAEELGLKLAIKPHPFENVKTHRRRLRRYLGKRRADQTLVLDGRLPQFAWNRVEVALTVQSSVALECTRLRIPVFLCAWLQDPFSGYPQQFARFGAGRILRSIDELADIPRMLAGFSVDATLDSLLSVPIEPACLRELLTGGELDSSNANKSLAAARVEPGCDRH